MKILREQVCAKDFNSRFLSLKNNVRMTMSTRLWKLHSWLITEILQNRMHSQCKGPQSSQIGVLVASGIIPRYIKHPALIAPRILAAVSDEVATEATTTTPMKLMHATVHFVSRMHMDISTSITAFKCAQDKHTKCYAYRQDWSLGIAPRMHPPSKW